MVSVVGLCGFVDVEVDAEVVLARCRFWCCTIVLFMANLYGGGVEGVEVSAMRDWRIEFWRSKVLGLGSGPEAWRSMEIEGTGGSRTMIVLFHSAVYACS